MKNNIAWKRIINVTLYTDTGYYITFGNQFDAEETYNTDGTTTRVQKNGLHVTANGTKYLSPAKDEFTVCIYNLDYTTICKLIALKYRNIKIEVGYESLNGGIPTTIFDGGVLYISNDRSNLSQNITYIICTSRLIARYSEKNVNLTLNSGINMYAALKYIGAKAGISNIYISPEFKGRTLSSETTTEGTISSALTDIINSSNSYSSSLITASTDSSDTSSGGSSAVYNILSLYKTSKRKITIKASDGLLINKYATISTEGVKFQALCTVNLCPGDLIELDNSLIDMSFQSKSAALQAASTIVWIDQETITNSNGEEVVATYGYYYVWEVSYSLDNGSGDMIQTIIAKSKNAILGLKGSLGTGEETT